MTTTTFFIPAVNMMGNGCLDEAILAIRGYGLCPITSNVELNI